MVRLDSPSLFPEQSFTHLYILGNGFDIAHKLRTKYSDFRSWMRLHHEGDAFMLMDYLDVDKKDLLWSNFEEALGMMDIEKIKNTNLGNLYLVFTSDSKYIGSRLADADIFSRLGCYFSEWAKDNNKDLKRILPIYPFEDRSLYINFNYTDTLEVVYGIPEARISHINGRASKEEKVVIGHNRMIDPVSVYSGNPNLVRAENDYLQNIMNYEDLVKDGYAQVEKLPSYFRKSLSEVKYVNVIGHSYGTVDNTYYKTIRNLLSDDVTWLLHYHSEEDLTRLKSFIKAMKFKSPVISKI